MKTKTQKLTLAAIMVALSVVLSFTKLYEAPYGGSVTFGSMLPVMLLSLTLGWKWGLACGASFTVFQLIQGFASQTLSLSMYRSTIVICILFDYLLPFTLLGLAGMLRNLRIGRFRHFGAYAGIVSVCAVRFLCHYISGVAIWGQFGMDYGIANKWLYSLLYNGGYMLPELVITLILAALLLESAGTRRLISLPVDRTER